METATRRALLLLLLVASTVPEGLCDTNSQDVSALGSLMIRWSNYPASWASGDPCDSGWDGIMCSNGSVTHLMLSSVNLRGTLSDSVSQLSQLLVLDLSFNVDLGGTLPASIGNLSQLTTLIVVGCNFHGGIPNELGNLLQLSFLALGSNYFRGTIPASLGLLSNLFWLDLGDNQLEGPVPISTASTPGLNQLIYTQHFHFYKNQLSGNLTGLFNSNMSLIHLLFDSNQFSGSVPAEIADITSLQIIRLDSNKLEGAVPNLTNLVQLNELNLASNSLAGSLPDLSSMNMLNVVDLSNNEFNSSAVPNWFTTLKSLTSLVLNNNNLIGELVMSGSISKQLQSVNLQYNSILSANVTIDYKNTLMLIGNLACSYKALSDGPFCQPSVTGKGYSTSMDKCSFATSCRTDQSQNPANCSCAYSYNGQMTFIAPLFTDVTNTSLFQQLERSLWTQLNLSEGAVELSDVHFNSNKNLLVQVSLFPSSGMLFNISEVITLGFTFSNQSFKPPPYFGPYKFRADRYVPFIVASGKKSKFSAGTMAGLAAAGGVLLISLILLGFFSLRQKRRNRELKDRANPFALWGTTQKDSGGTPQIKGARSFSFEELRRCTDNFSESHEIGEGGYGKVYKGTLVDGIRVAIKRAQSGSMQGALEFKNEIELLSRVHHGNLVSLIGFCFEQQEQMLVYELIAGGTLRENLLVRGSNLDWKKRLRMALGAARGLAYLHEFADPPIIHRDIKSTNILLDESLKAKVADFGLSKLISDAEKGHVSTQVKGTLGYLDPEYYMMQQLSEKSDVYSFGIVMLELVSGRPPLDKGKYIVREVRDAIDPGERDSYGLRAIIDPAIRDAARTAGFRRFVHLAIQCVDDTAAERPAMGTVVKEVEAMLLNEPDGDGDNFVRSTATKSDGAGRGATPARTGGNVEMTRSAYGGGDNAPDYVAYFDVNHR